MITPLLILGLVLFIGLYLCELSLVKNLREQIDLTDEILVHRRNLIHTLNQITERQQKKIISLAETNKELNEIVESYRKNVLR